LFIDSGIKREAIKRVTEQHLNVAAADWQLDVAPKSILSWIVESKCGELKVTSYFHSESRASLHIIVF
jgi:hypothetical protein